MVAVVQKAVVQKVVVQAQGKWSVARERFVEESLVLELQDEERKVEASWEELSLECGRETLLVKDQRVHRVL